MSMLGKMKSEVIRKSDHDFIRVITDWDLVEEGFFGDADEVTYGDKDAFLELYDRLPESMPDEKYVEMANEFCKKREINLVFLKKLSQDDDGVITWEVRVRGEK